jgi:hypothetical protein
MINFKFLGYGVVASLALGLTGCYMDGQRAQQPEYGYQGKVMTHKSVEAKQEKAVAHKTKASASREPIQQVAPGPKRAAAPQLPVIQ